MNNKAIPIIIFIVVQLASVAVLVLWIVFYANVDISVWWLIQGIILMVPVIGGEVAIFIFWSKSRMLNAEQENFISSVSHELLTPLASIRLYVETMMMRELDSEKRAEFLKLMLDDSERLSLLISKILTASRIQHRKKPYEFASINLSDFIRDFVKDNKSLLRTAEVDLDLEDDIYCSMDSDSFSMVIKNLLENSIHYSPDKPQIKIRLARDMFRIKLVVTDKGEGLDSSERKKIFRLFYRASKSRRGTGLGLYLVNKIVKAHKGNVHAESPGKGKGMSVIIMLPESGESMSKDTQIRKAVKAEEAEKKADKQASKKASKGA